MATNIGCGHPQVADYAAWQRKHLAGSALDSQIEFWKKTLAGAAPLLELPWEKSRPKQASSVGVPIKLAIEPAIGAALRQMAAEEHTTLFVVLLSAVQVKNLAPAVTVSSCAERNSKMRLQSLFKGWAEHVAAPGAGVPQPVQRPR